MQNTALLFQQLGISFLLGLLVGLQREHAASGFAGMRTFPLITLLGTVSAILANTLGGWVVAAALLGLAAVLGFVDRLRAKDGELDHGTTTEVAVLLMFCVGALLVVAPISVAIAVGGGVAVLLQFKPELHSIAKKLGDQDLRAIMQFVLITCIILPVLPNQAYGPFDVLNPFQIWLMVVLIVGMSLGGYIIYKFLGRDAGILLGGILGGAISSTATTVSYSRQAHERRIGSAAAAIVILIASTIVFVRVLVETAVVAPDFLPAVAVPILVLMLLTAIPALAVWYRIRRQSSPMPEQENPTQLKSAVLFALMYAIVLFALAGAGHLAQTTDSVGTKALYVVAGLSGMTDMDAITLSASQMVRTAQLPAADGWRLIVIAALANLVFKTAVIGLIGNRRLLGQVALLLAIPTLGGIGLLAFWPHP